MFLPGSPGTRDCPNQALNWPNQALPKGRIYPTDSPKCSAPALTGLSTVSCYMYDLSANMIIHFLHMEPSNPPTYYTDLGIDIFRLHVGITLTGLQPRLPGSPMVKSHIYIYIYVPAGLLYVRFIS